jgi:hypothetical protein
MGAKKIYLVGWEAAGPWTILANALCGNAVDRTAADIDQFRFDKMSNTNDQMMLPGALKYGGLPAFTALCVPRDLYLFNHKGAGMDERVKPAYQAAKATDHLELDSDKASSDKVIEWLLR